ncbi:hypothetical protein ACFSBZ_15830 [Amnibacterium flavum]|uniref:Uncharacterized protein n=1 Tax=Amnibacterium flavum TaxID=2173173 RepID=A0A2V1HWC7_9MICO|nr:hypothetical protein [Amnibacterium flavum]PVZ96172.1 hypothetical protein DDQ50_07020 [Amnibacterium flavum]
MPSGIDEPNNGGARVSDRSVRTLGALATASISTFVAMFAHVVGGGSPPGFVTLALAFALAALVCLALSSVALSIWRTTVAVVVSQAGFHGLFAITGTAGSLAVAHQHGGAMQPEIGASPVPPMFLAHAAAAVLTAAIVLLGRRTLDATAAIARRVVVALLRFTLIPVRRTGGLALPADSVSTPPPLRELLGTLRHRGPPVRA